MTVIATDNFTAANGTQLETYNSNWTIREGAFDIFSNSVAPDAAGECTAVRNAESFDDDQYVEATVVAISSGIYVGLVVRCDLAGAVNYYMWAADSADQGYLVKFVEGENTVLLNGGSTFSVSDRLRFEVEGTTLRGYINDVLDMTITDASIASGSPGLKGLNDGTASRLDNWEAGNLAVVIVLNVAGSLTPAGSLVRQPHKGVAGSVSPAGTALKSLGRLWGGVIVPTGVTIRQAGLRQAGSLTPSGGLLLQVRKLLAGSLTPSGTVATIRTVLLSLAGSLTPGGIVIRQVRLLAGGAVQPVGAALKSISRGWGGEITPTGTVSSIHSILLSLAGSVGPSGMVARQVDKLVAGVVAPVGSLSRSGQKLLSGQIMPTGTASSIRSILLSLAGSVGPSGMVARQVRLLTGGAVQPVGAALKSISRGWGGVVTPAGTAAFIKTLLLSVTGSLTPSGVVGRRVNKVFSGALGISGGLGKRASRLFNGALSPSGLVSFGETVVNEVQTLAKAMFKAMFKRMR